MEIKRIRLALIQTGCKIRDKENNFSHALDFLEKAKMKTDIACLSEFFTTGYNLDLIGNDFYGLA